MELCERALSVATKRLFKRNAKGEVVEDYSALCRRVANHLGKTADEKDEFYDIMFFGYFLPNSPCLVNAGIRGRSNQLSACYVLGIEDSIENIYDVIKTTALIHKHGGGTGFSFSNLRSEDSRVGSTNGVASGPVSFMKMFDASTECIKQGGIRRGANMGIMRVDHPDIMKFINCKRGKDALRNFNISVAVTDAFMEALMHGGDYDLIDPHTEQHTHQNAQVIWDALVDNAWLAAEPGIIFIDTINKHNPLVGEENVIESTNPCGEQPLVPNEACGLGSINISAMVIDGVIDYDLLHKVTTIAIKFLNRMLDRSTYPNEQIHNRVLDARKIGLGIMGWADTLIKLKIPYTSPPALNLAETLIQRVLDSSVLATHDLGVIEGVFPLVKSFKIPTHIKESLRRCGIRVKDYKPRNSTLLTIAPTGTLSIIADCSSGIEPVFFEEQTEKRVVHEMVYKHPLFSAFREKFPKLELPNYFQVTKDIDVDSHVQMQATFQHNICSAVSKTVNLPDTATRDDVAQVFKDTYLLGCKGVTIYRDGVLENQVISDSTQKVNRAIVPESRPKILEGKTFEIKTGYGDMLVTLNYFRTKPFEVICQLGKSGASELATAEAIGRLASTLLRCGVATQTIVEQLEGIRGNDEVFSEYGLVTSIPDALAKVLSHHTLEVASAPVSKMTKCKDCNADYTHLQREGTCLVCKECGWKSCGG